MKADEDGRRETGTRTGAARVVLGGGLAGAAVATLIARGGEAITLIEQHATPRHKVCGDFLSAEALGYLTAMGLAPRGLGAVPLTRLRLATGRRVTETALPFPAASLTRFALDEALLQLAAGQPGVSLLRGQRVEGLRQGLDASWEVALGDGSLLRVKDVFLATGKHDLRGHPRAAGRHGTMVAFKQYLRLSAVQHDELGDAIELILFRGGYAGLQPVEPDVLGPRANLCLVVEGTRFGAVGNTWAALLRELLDSVPHLRRRMADAEPLLEKPLALSRIPYGLLVAQAPAATLWPVGDQAAVIPSLTGDGMSLALHSAHVAAQVYQSRSRGAHGDAAEYLAEFERTLRGQIGLATVASRVAVQRVTQPLIGVAAAIEPGLLRELARLTRIPAAARLSGDRARNPGRMGY